MFRLASRSVLAQGLRAEEACATVLSQVLMQVPQLCHSHTNNIYSASPHILIKHFSIISCINLSHRLYSFERGFWFGFEVVVLEYALTLWDLFPPGLCKPLQCKPLPLNSHPVAFQRKQVATYLPLLIRSQRVQNTLQEVFPLTFSGTSSCDHLTN